MTTYVDRVLLNKSHRLLPSELGILFPLSRLLGTLPYTDNFSINTIWSIYSKLVLVTLPVLSIGIKAVTFAHLYDIPSGLECVGYFVSCSVFIVHCYELKNLKKILKTIPKYHVDGARVVYATV
ncbi:Hypothetical protein NTJ_07279 [Nesidiocoris tenuis]|uniref:Uncharacterized protein n=1 Tax=Nesidiocoris tenuis TaxID=355587 RepID=A0ABN7AU68_9HEMI|nr:Hypothetical protein NTJ_07279 [Nesidiocoris tenuis]